MAISRAEFQRRHLKQFREWINGDIGQELLRILEAEHPVRMTKTPPSSEGHALCQGYETAVAVIRELRDFDFRRKESSTEEFEPTEEQLATSPPTLTDENDG